MLLVSDYLMNKFLDHTFRATTYTAPAAVYLALLKAIPIRQTATPASEVTGTGYARKAITFGAAANGRVLNSAAVLFDAPTADWATEAGPIVALAIMDAESAGNWLVATPICSRIVLNGDPKPEFEIGALKVIGDFIAMGC